MIFFETGQFLGDGKNWYNVVNQLVNELGNDNRETCSKYSDWKDEKVQFVAKLMLKGGTVPCLCQVCFETAIVIFCEMPTNEYNHSL